MKTMDRNLRLSTSSPFETLEGRQLLSGNVSPIAIDDSYFVPVNRALAVSVAQGVLANDQGAGKSIPVVVDAPLNGSFVLNKNGGFVYSPNAGYTGDDLFTYAFKGDPENIAYVCLEIVDSPVAQDDSYSSANGKFITVNKQKGLLGNDVFFDGQTHTVSVVDAPANGKLSLNPNGALIYMPNKGFEGDDSFTYRIDGTDSVANVDLVFSTLTVISGNKNNSADDEDIIITLKPKIQAPRPGHNPARQNVLSQLTSKSKTKPLSNSRASNMLLSPQKSLF